MKEQKVMEVIKNDINSFSKLVLTISVVQAANTVNELIKVIIEDNFNEKKKPKKIKN